MKFFTSQLIILASSLGAFALSVRSGTVPLRVAEACPSARVLDSSTVNVNGQDIVRQVLSCPDSNFASSLLSESSMLSPRGFVEHSALEARSAAECTTPAAECQCGQAGQPYALLATSLRC